MDSIILDLPHFKILEVKGANFITFKVNYLAPQVCPHCDSTNLRKKDSFVRRIKHIVIGQRPSWLELKAHKFLCRGCGRYFNSRFPGILPRKQASEPCRVEIAKLHHNGWTQSHLAKDFGLGSATVERWYQDRFRIKNQELKNSHCPRILGIDEHFFTKKKGFATTFADLSRHKVFDVTLGRSEASLKGYMAKLIAKERVKVVVMDLSETYRSIAKKYFINALIVADRFHVMRLVNQQFVRTWAELDEQGRKHRGLVSLMRRKPDRMKPEQRLKLDRYLNNTPGLRALYDFWHGLQELLRNKSKNQKDCRPLVKQYLWYVEELRQTPFRHLRTLGATLDSWKEEIARMFRFSKTNGITEGLHNKMEMLSRRAYGFRNYENYRLRVRVVCG
jgi:transposase